MIDAVERGDPDQRRWYVRLLGEDKDVWTAWWTLDQRMFRYETFLMPSPEENRATFFEHLLVRNRELTGMSLEIGEEEAVFLAGSLPVRAVTEADLDRILGSMWAYVERIFRPALRIGFVATFRRLIAFQHISCNIIRAGGGDDRSGKCGLAPPSAPWPPVPLPSAHDHGDEAPDDRRRKDGRGTPRRSCPRRRGGLRPRHCT